MRIKGRTYRKGSLRVGESSGEDEERDWSALVKQVVDAQRAIARIVRKIK
jgi:hypothetical protein